MLGSNGGFEILFIIFISDETGSDLSRDKREFGWAEVEPRGDHLVYRWG